MQDIPWRDLKAFIEDKGNKNAENNLLLYDDRAVSYREAHETSNVIANNFRHLGIGKGDHVLVFLYNSPEYLMIWFALAKLGAVMVPLNTALRSQDLTHIIEDSQSRYIIVETDLLESYGSVRDKFRMEKEVIISTGPADIPTDMLPFERMTEGPGDNLDTNIHMSDPLCIIYTSGTTGKPKGVVLPHFCYINSGIAIKEYARLQKGDRVFSTLPLFHIGAQLLIAVPAMMADVDFALMRRFSASRFWAQVRKYQCNVVHYLGSLAQILYVQKERPDDADNPAERMIGGGMSRDVWEKFERRFGVTVCEGYGLTEAGCLSSYNPLGQIKVGSIGLPVRHQRIEIVNDDDEIVPAHTHGEIVVRPEIPYSMMLEYYNNPAATLDVWRNLWFHTGDIGYKDEEGYLYFVGRKSYFMRRRGENVSAEEVEEVINKHPSVKVSAVVGVPSEMGDDDIKSYIVSKKGTPVTPEDIIRWCEDKIAYFKIPRYIEFIEELPMTATNRIERHKLKELGIGQAWDREKSGFKLKSR